jgi:hypothetical protein
VKRVPVRPPTRQTPAPAPPLPAPAQNFILHGPVGTLEVSPGHPADTRQVSAEHPAGVPETPAGHPKPRAPAGSAVLFERKSGKAKRRMNVYFDPDVFARLEEHCRAEDEDLSRYINDAVARSLGAKGGRR